MTDHLPDWTARVVMTHHWHSKSQSASPLEGDVPTYQYACTVCGHQLEAVQAFSDDPLTVCPECEGRLRKVYGAVGVVFKGSGFYRTDSRSGKSGSTGPKKEPAATPASASDGSSSSSSPATSGTATGSSSTSTSSSSTASPAGTAAK